jgi:hypothetical protein
MAPWWGSCRKSRSRSSPFDIAPKKSGQVFGGPLGSVASSANALRPETAAQRVLASSRERSHSRRGHLSRLRVLAQFTL